MALIRLTPETIVELIRSDGDSILGGIDARLQRGLVEVLLVAQAGAISEAFAYLQQIADDVFPDTATSDSLDRWAGIFALSRGSSTFASGWIGAAGVITEIPAGLAVFRRGDGQEFETLLSAESPAGAIISTPTAAAAVAAWTTLQQSGPGWALPVRAIVPGAAGNTAAGSSLSVVSPVAGFATTGSAFLGISGAVDVEADALLRDRVLARMQSPPQGGTAADFKAWALAASTDADPIARAFVMSPAPGANTVTIYLADDGGSLPAARPPTATATAVSNAVAYIDDRRPLHSQLVVANASHTALNLTLSIPEPAAEVVTAIENEIDGHLIENHAPGDVLPLSLLQAAISAAAGGLDVAITTPSSNPTPAATDDLYYRGAITWTP